MPTIIMLHIYKHMYTQKIVIAHTHRYAQHNKVHKFICGKESVLVYYSHGNKCALVVMVTTAWC